MATHKALVLPSRGSALSIEQRPIPSATPGSAVLRILATPVYPNAKDMFSGANPLPLRTPLVPGSCAVARIHALGADSTSLSPNQLVFADLYTRSRDDPDASVLQGYMGFDAGSEALMEHEWRDGSYAQYARFPLENIHALDEDLLVGKMGYSLPDLTRLGALFIAAAGTYEAGIQAGDTVIVAPATGYFGGAAVQYALAVGARVIAAARNPETLEKMNSVFGSSGRFASVVLKGDVQADTQALKAACPNPKGADAYVDWSPPAAAASTHFEACIGALRPHGTAMFMGGVMGSVHVSYLLVMMRSIRIQGYYMYERWHAQRAMRLLGAGLLKLGEGLESGIRVERFGFEDAVMAVERAGNLAWGSVVVLEM